MLRRSNDDRGLGRTLSGFLIYLLGLTLAGCTGSLTFGGNLWADDDDSASDDDDSAVGDDDDSSVDDDDDDDTGPTGGEVQCGQATAPGPDWGGGPSRAYTGETSIVFERNEERGSVFSADWEGCEALHRFDEDGSYLCGIRWLAEGESYAEQEQTNQFLVRFDMNFTLDENTCGNDPEAADRQIYFRLELPKEEPVATILYSDKINTPPAGMEFWARTGYIPSVDLPERVDLLYTTEFSTDD
ncbi:MAG: hypothetical protein VX498_00560 [Myxococcota bacterium]|nr:hypothetical protein [Myxococcota bacterium]